MRLFLIHEDDVSGANGAFRQYVSERLIEAGHQVVGPLSVQPPRDAQSSAGAHKASWYKYAKELAVMVNESNCMLIEEVDLMVYLAADAVGPATGVALGYALAKRTPVILHRGDYNNANRVEDSFDLQLESLVAHSGGRVVTTVPGLLAALMMREAERELRAAE